MSQNKIVFIDVDTQVDFMLPTGNLYVPGAEQTIPNLERLMIFARDNGVPVVSSADAHSVNDPEFEQFPPHCVKGTPGQQKIPQTLLPLRTVIPNEKQPLPEGEQFSHCQQWILEKQKFDLFTNVNAASLLGMMAAEGYITFGVATEYCVRAAILGLLRLGRPVWLVEDAIRGIDPDASQAVLRELQEAGARLLKTQEVETAILAASGR